MSRSEYWRACIAACSEHTTSSANAQHCDNDIVGQPYARTESDTRSMAVGAVEDPFGERYHLDHDWRYGFPADTEQFLLYPNADAVPANTPHSVCVI